MAETMGRNWWVLLIRGIAAILFGIAAFVLPGVALATLVLLVGAYFFVDGIFTIIQALQARSQPRWWVSLLEGIVSVIAGIGVFVFTDVAGYVLLNIIAFWAILTGILEIVLAIQLREQIRGEFWMGLAGLGSIIFGILVILFPNAGALSIVWMIATYAILFGVVMILLAFRVRSMAGSTNTTDRTATNAG